MRRPRSLVLAIIASLGLALAGCGSRSAGDTLASGVAPPGAVVLFDAGGRPVELHSPESLLKKRTILAISGGGSHGAFGAGVLTGWTSTGKRPSFDIVTGISTGALMASFAFLGPAYDGQLRALYTESTSQDIFLGKGLAGLFGVSVFDTNPLRKKIDATITPEFLDAVAEEHRRGRRLYVGTTNLDEGVLVVWDMGNIASSENPGKRELYRDVLLASAAIPGLFEPVYLPKAKIGGTDHAMHVDGGVKAPLLLRTFMLDGMGQKNVYLLVNGQMTLRDGDKLVAPQTLKIAQKSINELLRGLLYKTAYQAYVASRNAGAQFHFTAIPDTEKPTIDPIDFDPAGMKDMFEDGYAIGKAGTWSRELPRLEKLERVAGRRME